MTSPVQMLSCDTDNAIFYQKLFNYIRILPIVHIGCPISYWFGLLHITNVGQIHKTINGSNDMGCGDVSMKQKVLFKFIKTFSLNAKN